MSKIDHDSIFNDPELAELIGESINGVASSPTVVARAAQKENDQSPKLDETIQKLLSEADTIVSKERNMFDISSKKDIVPNSPLIKETNTKTDDEIINSAISNVISAASSSPVNYQVFKTAVGTENFKIPLTLTESISAASKKKKSADCAIFSLDDENTILHDILKNIIAEEDMARGGEDDEPSSCTAGGVNNECDDICDEQAAVDRELEEVLAHAERLIAAGENSLGSSTGPSIVRIQEISNIKVELEKARTTAGAPSCVDNCIKWASEIRSATTAASRDRNAVSSIISKPVIAVGTTMGMVLLFNSTFKMSGVCGSVAAASSPSAASDTNKGATTSISFSRDGSSIVAGYEGGQVTIWDTDTLHPLKTVEGEFIAPIIKISFFHPDSTKFAALDAAGNLKTFQVGTVMGKYVGRSSTIHTGFEAVSSDLSVTSDHVPITSTNGSSEVVKEINYVAVICRKQLSVFAVTFGLQTTISLIFTAPPPKCSKSFSSEGPTHELLSWIEDNQQRKLVTCWSNVLEVYHVLSDCTGHITLQRTAQFECDRTMLSSSFLNGCCVLFADNTSRIHIFDASHNIMAQTCQLNSQFELISFPFPDVKSPGGRGQKIPRYWGQMSHSGGSITLQGKSRFAICTLKTWEERVNDLLLTGQWDALFSLAKDLSQDMAVAVVGLSTIPSQRKANIQKRVEEILNSYITEMNEQLKPLKNSDACNGTEHLIPVIDKILSFCSDTQLQDLFFSSVMPKLEELRASDRGLYALEGALKSGKFNSVPAIYISNFAKLFRSPSRFALVNRPELNPIPPGVSQADHALRRMETALMRITNDLPLLITTSETLKLYRLLCCILSFRQHKYVEALKSVLPSFSASNGSETGGSIEVAFDYLELLFEDKSLIEKEPIISCYRKNAKESVIAFIVEEPKALNDLLKHDAMRFITLAAYLIDPPKAKRIGSSFPDVSGDSSIFSDDCKTSASTFFSAFYAQMVDTTIAPNKPWEYERKKWPSYGAILQIYINFVPPFSDGKISLPQTSADDFSQRASFHFIYAYEKANLERRHAITAAFVSLIGSSRWNENLAFQVEGEVKAKRLGRVYAAILAVKGDYIAAISCFLGREYNQVDPYLASGVFLFISSEIRNRQVRGDFVAIETIRQGVKTHLSTLIRVDAVQLSQLVFEHLPDDHNEVFRTLRGIGDTTFLMYMRGMMAKGDRSVKEDKYTQNVYINLLCQHDPSSVYDYLVKNGSEIQYDLGQALRDCQQHQVTDAIIYLLEKTMQLAQAMDSLMAAITDRLIVLREKVIREPEVYESRLESSDPEPLPSQPESPSEKSKSSRNIARSLLYDNDKQLPLLSEEDGHLAAMVNLGIDLCNRYAHKLSLEDLKIWWFRLLERFSGPKRLLHDRQSHQKDNHVTHLHHFNANVNTPVNGYEDNEVTFSGNFPLLTRPLSPEGVRFLAIMEAVYARYVSHILTAMVKTLPLSTVVGKIVEDNARDSFGPFKQIIVGILETLSFDLEANRLCKLCADGDTLLIAEELKKTATSGIVPSTTLCPICKQHLSVVVGDIDSLRVYPCGHGFHEVCCGTLDDCYVCSRWEEHFGEGSLAYPDGGAAADGIPTPNKAAIGLKNTPFDELKKDSSPQINTEATMRKLRQIQSKIDNSRMYKDMLDSIVKGGSDALCKKRGNKGQKCGSIIVDGVNLSDIDTTAFGGGNNLILAPPAKRSTLSVTDIIYGTNQQAPIVLNGSKVDEELTDNDLISILGKAAFESMRQGASEEEDKFLMDVDGVDDDEWGEEAFRELMNHK